MWAAVLGAVCLSLLLVLLHKPLQFMKFEGEVVFMLSYSQANLE